MGGDIVMIMLGVLIVLILMGVHIGVALALCSGVGVYIMFRGNTEAALADHVQYGLRGDPKGCVRGDPPLCFDGGFYMAKRGRRRFISNL